MRGDEQGAGQVVKIALAIGLIVVVVSIVVLIFFKTTPFAELMKMVIEQGLSMMWGGIKQASLKFTTIG